MKAATAETIYSPEVIANAKEYKRCFQGYAYFVDQYCWIQDRKSGKSIPFKLWPGQAESVDKILKAEFLMILKARQLGLTWLVASYALWKAMFHFNELIVVISANEDLAMEFLDRVKFMLDRLPDWMKPSVYKRTATELTFAIVEKDSKGNEILKGLNSTIKSNPTTQAAGQSKTISLLVLDESALNRYCKDIWSAAKPTLEHAGGHAIIISNPTKTMPGWPWTRDMYMQSMKGGNEFERIFLNWQCVPGRGDGFLDQQRRAGLDEDDISMQYPTTEDEAISILGGSYFGKLLAKFKPYDGERGFLAYKDDSKIEVLFAPDKKGIVEIWDKPVPHKEFRYAVGSDIAEGLGGDHDSSVAYVYDRQDCRYVARMRSNKIAADEWADELVRLAKYYNDAYICPERTGAGITTVKRLTDLIYPFLFVRKKPGRLKGEWVMEYGWQTSHETKQLMADDLKKYMREIFTQIPCGILIDECSTFIRHDNGKLEHEEGHHDDCVIAAGLAIQASLLMPSIADLSPKDRPSMYDRRIERLERTDDPDDYESWAIEEQRLAMADLGQDDFDIDVEEYYEDRGEIVPTIMEG